MPYYVERGAIPGKRHVQHRVGGRLTYEELVSREGFSDVASNAYHLRPPTALRGVGASRPLPLLAAADEPHRHRHVFTSRLPAGGCPVFGRRVLAFNDDLVVSTCEPVQDQPDFYRNALADELVFVHHGAGTLESMYGDLDFGPGDYLVVPRGTTHRLRCGPGRVKLFVVETRGPVQVPRHFRSDHGQLMEHAPYCERDLRAPRWREPVDEPGEFPVLVKLRDRVQETTLAHHPFDLVGWDGFCYPWAFNIGDFMPVVGKVHLPPPVHVTFTAPGLVVCSFVPRLFDFHPEAVPIPYAHSNVDSDEILYYVEGNFMSRRGIESESLTLHPMGYPHGPQPGLIEKSLGAKETGELAVMVDTFAPLRVGRDALAADDPAYPLSWLEGA